VKKEAMIYAETNCRSLCMGKVDYSPDVNKTSRGLQYVWQLVVKHLSRQNVKPENLRKVSIVVGIQGDPLHSSITLGDACHAFNSMDEAYQLYKVNEPMMRVDFLKKHEMRILQQQPGSRLRFLSGMRYNTIMLIGCDMFEINSTRELSQE
jgi:hypothetical protein